MLCPEVWNLKSPQHHLEIKRSSCMKNEIPPVISTHYYNHSISIVFPHSNNILPSLQNCIIDDTDYYKIECLSPSLLINKEFIEAFVKKGELTLLSVNRKIDVDNCIAITPTGHLVLSLTVEDYQKFGLEGKPSFFDRKIHSRYIVTINLRDDTFTPGKSYYERVRRCLETNFDKKFDVILMWDPPDEKLCPSSVAAWFHSRQSNVSICHGKLSTRIHHSIPIPIVTEDCNINEFFEWIGIISFDGDTKNGNADDYLNTYSCPSPNILADEITYVEFTGFFTRSKINKISSAITNLLQCHQKSIPWISLHVHGFADSPLSWNLKEHTYFTDGDNSYTIVYQPNGDYIVQKSSNMNKLRTIQ